MKRTRYESEVFLEWRGRTQLIAEGIRILSEYEDDHITALCGTQKLTVNGSGLILRFLSEDRVVVEGRIDRVFYEDA